MKHIVLVLITLVMCYSGHAQLDEANTFSDITLAKAYAKKQEVPILMIFAGSDWCKPCIQFKKGILLSQPFSEYASKNLTILYLDFPLKKANKLPKEQTAHNEKLAEKYNPSGAFPEILMINANEEILGNLSFKNQAPEEFIASCQALKQ
ncbi:MAG: thioredoxin family protein [Cyclobacteriaceae bacterium]